MEQASLPPGFRTAALTLLAASMPIWLGCQGPHKLTAPASPVSSSDTPRLVLAEPLEHALVSQVADVEESSGLLEAPEYSINALVQSALGSHPKIQAARARVSAALHRVPQARALEDPMMNNQFWPIRDNALQTVGGRMEYQIDVSQRLPWPDKRDAKAAIACRESQMAQQELAATELEIAEAVRLAYADLWLAQQAIDIVEQSSQYLREALTSVESRYRSGTGSQQDVIGIEVELGRLANRISELEGERRAAHAMLVSYVRHAGITSIRPYGDAGLPLTNQSLEEWIATASVMNPELQRLAIQIQRDLQKQRLANLQRYPDLQVGTQYGFMTAKDALSPVADGLDNLSFSVGFTLPVWKEKINSGVREAMADRIASTQSQQAEMLTITGALEAVLASIDSLEQQRMRYAQQILPRAEQAVELGLNEYRVGKTEFVQLVANYRELLDVRLELARVEATLSKRLAQLQRLAGTT